MPIYSYRCPTCRTEVSSTQRGDRLSRVCRGCGSTEPLKRVYGFSYQPGMQEHFNTTVGKPVSSMQKFADELARASDRASEQTGIEHNYKPVEWGDTQALGVTNEGIAESNAIRARRGEPLLPDIGGSG